MKPEKDGEKPIEIVSMQKLESEERTIQTKSKPRKKDIV